jgi:hypothetical protein
MSDQDQAALLAEIRDLQKDALDLARKQFAMTEKQFERAEALHARAERIQERSEGMISVARKAFVVILPVIAVLLAYLTWLIFR